MYAQFLGKQGIRFLNDNGEEISGTNIFCAFKDEQVEGLRVQKFYLKEGITLPKDTKLNDTIDLVFNMRGKVEMIFKAN